MNHLRHTLMVLTAVLLLTGVFSACELWGPAEESITGDERIEIAGTWDDGWGTRLMVSETEIVSTYDDGTSSSSYTMAIVSYSNSTWNADESTLASGNHGYAVIQYTEAPSWNSSMQDRYMIFRWQDLSTTDGVTTMSYAEGSDYDPTTGTSTFFDTPEAAETGATSADNFFGWFTTGAVKL